MRRSFPRQMASLEAIVAFVGDFVAEEGLDEDAASNLDLVLEELFTNLVRHGRGARSDVEIALSHGPDGTTARLTETNAERFDPTTLPEVDVHRPIAERRPGGLGVHFIRNLTKVFQYEYRDRTGVITVALREPS